MPDASVPATPMRGSEQVVFRLHRDKKHMARHERGRFFWHGRHLAKLFLARAFDGWAKVDTTGVMARIRWLRGRCAVLGYHLRDSALANRALVRQDFEAFVIEKAEAVNGDSRTLNSIVKELEVRKRGGFKKVVLGNGSVVRAPSFDEIADVVAILPKWRADGVPNEASKAAPMVTVSQLVSLLRQTCSQRVAWHQVV